MSDQITELRVISDNGNLFDTDTGYVIPLYQRAFAWEDQQLIQLIEDISDVAEGTPYYIGTLIVAKHGNSYEVVDGQQRLTALFLLLNILGFRVKSTLTFACRERSNYTLSHIRQLLEDSRSELFADSVEPPIKNGIDILLQETVGKEDFDKDGFIRKLSQVIIYRIEVPEHTDLNRYFEIMNTRGEQLEQHDILKAELMSCLPPEEHSAFAKIWNACSDMTGYVQMHFSDSTTREALFGGDWNQNPPLEWKRCISCFKSASAGTGNTIEDILNKDAAVNHSDGRSDDNTRVRFESVIGFPYFLLHTLRVWGSNKDATFTDEVSTFIADSMDDKKLLDSFSKVLDSEQDKARFVGSFIACLLSTRFLFDKYIIKREYANNNADGEWSLKSLNVSQTRNVKRPYYSNTDFSKLWTRQYKKDQQVKENIMIQSALRVSYTSPRSMHWITKLLEWLSKDNYCNTEGGRLENYHSIAERIAIKAVRQDFLDRCENGKYEAGVNTPHIVFNYLDYLLWHDEPKKNNDFTFEFRNSVEHWYPRNPSEDTFEQWADGVDRFGNLCLIQRNVNSMFSNLSPEAKKSTFCKMIDKGSLKLRVMRDLTEQQGGETANQYWKDAACEKHENEMIRLLIRQCDLLNAEKETDS